MKNLILMGRRQLHLQFSYVWNLYISYFLYIVTFNPIIEHLCNLARIVVHCKLKIFFFYLFILKTGYMSMGILIYYSWVLRCIMLQLPQMKANAECIFSLILSQYKQKVNCDIFLWYATNSLRDWWDSILNNLLIIVTHSLFRFHEL